MSHILLLMKDDKVLHLCNDSELHNFYSINHIAFLKNKKILEASGTAYSKYFKGHIR